ncbi:hypothetical protein KL86DYS2_20007 [uncultured Dysgonomonas sp.]|uniref:Uncharacterized protein n=1 Tax=uncultured Dysgonomonas sp. TaxID=206096 RepID=A0A212KET5_9BACT|nr:hypothetical protein KL86DYS2_20007 [uncultured Dysgonomonas sp.]
MRSAIDKLQSIKEQSVKVQAISFESEKSHFEKVQLSNDFLCNPST